MPYESGSIAYEQMNSKLIDSDCQDMEANPEKDLHTQPSVYATSLKPCHRLTSQGPYRLATACLSAFCLILLITLVLVNVSKKNNVTPGEDQNSDQNVPSSSKLTVCINVSTLTAENERLQKVNSELLKEINLLKDKINVLETTPTPKPVKCPLGWHFFNGSCYFISVGHRSWRDSQRYCVSQEGNLAIIHTPEEQTFIWDLLPRGHWNSYWFGISDENLEGDWYWVDGTKLVGGFWEDGEPNNHIDEDCGYIVKTRVLSRVAIKSWYDAPCTMSLPWICEKKAL